MNKRFEVILLGEVWDLLNTLEEKARVKILYNLDKSKYVNDPKLLKKLDADIWEFRTKYRSLQYKLFSSLDKADALHSQRLLLQLLLPYCYSNTRLPMQFIDANCGCA